MCVCVCVCVWNEIRRNRKRKIMRTIKRIYSDIKLYFFKNILYSRQEREIEWERGGDKERETERLVPVKSAVNESRNILDLTFRAPVSLGSEKNCNLPFLKYIYIYKFANYSRERCEGSLFNGYYTKVYCGALLFSLNCNCPTYTRSIPYNAEG